MIQIENVEKILQKPEIETGLNKYQYIMKSLHETDVSSDKEYQSVFRDFYQMRRFYSDEFAQHYFHLLEQMKHTNNMTFKMAIERVKHIQNTYEISFSSKLAHTINPLLPIWDSVVTGKHFQIRAPYASAKDREKACCQKYAEFEEKFYSYMSSMEGQALIFKFDQRFPDSGISDIKKIDFILWQDRRKTQFA